MTSPRVTMTSYIHFMRQLVSHLHHTLDVSFNLELEACREADKDGVHLSEVMNSPFPFFNVVHIHTLSLPYSARQFGSS